MEPPPRRHERSVARLEAKPPSLWRVLGAIVTVTAVFVIVAALLMRLVEPETFSTIGDALWFSVVTVSTVGYGDFVPHSGPGKFVAGAIMMFSLAFVPAVTSIIVSVSLARARVLHDAEAAAGSEEAP